MSDQIREQVSAFLDGELPDSETELLLKRLTRDADLRESFGRYALIGETLRGASRTTRMSLKFAARVNRAIDGEPAPAVAHPIKAAPLRWWKPMAGAAVAASVAAVAVVALQERALSPSVQTTLTAQSPVIQTAKLGPKEAQSYYITPASTSASGRAVPGARLTSYVFAHSNYASGLGQGNVMQGLLTDPDDLPPAPVLNDAVITQPRDPRIAP
jgi:sigma-E factor negative regulatory protein RseA